MQSFKHITPALRLHSGPDSLSQIGKELKSLNCERAVIFCGSTLSRSPLLDLVKEGAGERCVGVYAGVKAHSPHPALVEAADELKRLKADAVIAVGGGSAVVTARAASIYLAEGYDLVKLSTFRDENGRMQSPKLMAPKLPQLIVPTTPNTAVVKVGSGVYDPVDQRRYALFDPKVRAHSLYIHPDMLMSAPADLIISSSFDTLALALEGLTSPLGDPMADALLMHAMRLLAANLPDPALADNVDMRADLMFGAILAAQGTDYSSAGLVTALGHAIGANHHVENGISKSVLMPHTIRFNAEVSQKGLDKLATSLGVDPAAADRVEGIIAVLAKIFETLGVPKRLRDLDVPKDALQAIADRTMEDFFVSTNARRVKDASELMPLLSEAW